MSNVWGVPLPGDLVKIKFGSGYRLFGTPEMRDSLRTQDADIITVVGPDEVGLVVGSVPYPDKTGETKTVLFLLFGDRLGWRDPLPFVAIT